jgi:hypothetical protein
VDCKNLVKLGAVHRLLVLTITQSNLVFLMGGVWAFVDFTLELQLIMPLETAAQLVFIKLR